VCRKDRGRGQEDARRQGRFAQPLTRVKLTADFFIFFASNSLKSLDSAKGIQGNTSDFPWIYLDFLAANSRFG
jgi:hypothetical protein